MPRFQSHAALSPNAYSPHFDAAGLLGPTPQRPSFL